jgi:hypothetical protein
MALPLNKHYPDGRPYSRPGPIEAAIDCLLAENLDTLSRRARIHDRSSPEYIESECLVHLIRDARRRDDEATMYALLPPLLRRCESVLLSKVSKDLPNAQEIREEILGQFSETFAEDGSGPDPDGLDFFEVRFNSAFRFLRIDILRKDERLQKFRTSVEFSEEHDGKPISDEELSEYLRTPAIPERALILGELKEAIDALPPDERKAVILCHIMGYDQESDDQEKITAATICGVSGRTIRSRLTRAAVRLSSFKELIQ